MNNCFSCGSEEIESIPYINEYVSNDIIDWNTYNIKFCNNCGLGVIDPSISKEQLLKFYNCSYNSKDYNRNFFSQYIISKHHLSEALIISAFINTYDKKEISILDIGCGAFGYSFNSFNRIFSSNTLKFYGIDADPLAVKALKINGVEYLGEDYECLEGNKKFDIITMSHSLEHLCYDDVIGCLYKIKQHITEGGILLIDVPQENLRNKSRQTSSSAPHTVFFTKDSLERIVTRLGYKVLYAQTLGHDIESPQNNVKKNEKLNVISKIKSKIPTGLKLKIKTMFAYQINHNAYFENLFCVNKNGINLRVVAKIE